MSDNHLWCLYSDGDNYVPPNVTHLMIASNARDIPSSLCAGNQSLREVWFQPNSNCRGIGTSAFYACGNLTFVQLAPTVRLIGFMAFHDCPKLQVLQIATKTANECRTSEPQAITAERKFGLGFQCFKNARSLIDVSIVEGVRTISESCFQGCSSLRSISLPNTVEHLMKQAFVSCTHLEIILLNDGLRSIGDEAFLDCENLRAIPIPSSVERIGAKAFASCTNLEVVHLNTGLKSIVQEAFAGCENLRMIPIPSTVESIGSRAFENCKMLSSIELEKGPEVWLGDDIFRGCTNLIWISLPISPYHKRFYNRFHFATDTFFFDPSSLDVQQQHPSRRREQQKTVLRKAGDRLDAMEWYSISDHDCREEDEMEMAKLEELIQTYYDHYHHHHHGKICDDLGINMFHIMASSRFPRHNLFHALLLDRLPIQLLFQQDKILGMCPLKLLADNPSSQAHDLLLSLIPKLVLACSNTTTTATTTTTTTTETCSYDCDPPKTKNKDDARGKRETGYYLCSGGDNLTYF